MKIFQKKNPQVLKKDDVNKVILITKERFYMLSIHTNTAALRAQSALNSSTSSLSQATQRLSTGMRINSAKDDAAGLAISSSMEAQVRGMQVAARNTNDAISLVQTAEGTMGTGSNILQKMRELSVQAANGAMTDADRGNLDKEYQALASELTDMYSKANFNGKKILGADAGSFAFQTGANSGNTLTVTTVAGSTLFAAAGDLTSAANATTAIGALDTAITATASARSDLGAVMNRLDYVAENLNISITNTSDAKSRIVDADYATEVGKLSKSQILQQAGSAMLAQANQSPQLILSLLRG